MSASRFEVAKGNNYGRKWAYKRHGIALDAQVQITGAMFDTNAQVAQAVKVLNAVLARGESEAMITKWDGPFKWVMKWHNQDFDVLPVNLHPGVSPERKMVDGFYTDTCYGPIEA
jgi:hypothetical protein